MFSTVLESIYALPVSNQLAGLPVFPADFKGPFPPPTFLKLNLVFGETKLETLAGSKRLSGVIIVSIYYTSGGGQVAPSAIAENLNVIFEKKLLASGVTTKVGSLQFLGQDKTDPSLSRADYSIPFSYYGE